MNRYVRVYSANSGWINYEEANAFCVEDSHLLIQKLEGIYDLIAINIAAFPPGLWYQALLVNKDDNDPVSV